MEENRTIEEGDGIPMNVLKSSSLLYVKYTVCFASLRYYLSASIYTLVQEGLPLETNERLKFMNHSDGSIPLYYCQDVERRFFPC